MLLARIKSGHGRNCSPHFLPPCLQGGQPAERRAGGVGQAPLPALARHLPPGEEKSPEPAPQTEKGECSRSEARVGGHSDIAIDLAPGCGTDHWTDAS
jgi:hypothetical protein